MLRAPDLRLADVRTELLRGTPPFEHRVEQPGRGVFAYVRQGEFILEVDGLASGLAAPCGTAAGFEAGRAHRWRAVAAGAGGYVELLVGSIPQRMSVLQRLAEGMIVVPPDAEPHATILRHAVEIHACEIERPTPEAGDELVRRCAEICLIQFVRFARARSAERYGMPAGLAHDEPLLRAWSAYLADPQRRWTLQALAEAAGLGRTVFAERFRKVFGAPPLQTLTEMRLEQAETMLRGTRTTLIEIAFTVGYNSEAAFVRAFHRRYGIPPGRFRAEQAATPPA